ncbi:MAG: hypothetical protein GF364_17220 [Candidatus Lokiarchaeota archaeon]|nr:hypothetical protein [Candidatus Lokiarchaeota archaeon]
MTIQRYKTINSTQSPSINRVLDIATINQDDPIIITGGNDQNVQIYDSQLNLKQEIPFDGWIRACAVFDMNGDNNYECAIGSGDNTLRVFVYDTDKSEYTEVWRHKFEKNVSAIAAGDINADGRIEILAGTWSGKLGIFDALTGEKLWELEFSDWVTFLKVLDVNWDGIPEIVVGLKQGEFGVISGITGELYWDYMFEKRVNDCELVYLSNNHLPHLVVGGDANDLYIFNRSGQVVSRWKTEDRILAIGAGDIDGDCYNEIVLGTSDNRVVVLQTPEEKKMDENEDINTELEVRWKARVHNAPTSIKVFDLYFDEIPKIIVTGYFKEIRVLQDFFFGEEPKKVRTCLNADVEEKTNEINKAELITENGVFYFPKKISLLEDIIKIPEEMTRERKEKAAIIIKNHNTFGDLDKIENQAKELENQNKSLRKKLDSLKIDNISELIKKQKRTEKQKELEEIETSKSKSTESFDNRQKLESKSQKELKGDNREKIISLMEKVQTISSETKVMEYLIENDIEKSEATRIWSELKEEEKVSYSRSKPRGWSLN